MTINQKIRRIEQDADFAWEIDDAEEGARLDGIIRKLGAENERRLAAAKARFDKFDQEARDSGYLNASMTSASESGEAPTFGAIGDRALQMCEFWEMAVASAQSIVDSRD